MKIVDTYWETRNLGVSSNEIIIEEADNESDILKAVDSKVVYSVAKVNALNNCGLSLIQSHGYNYIEDQIHLEHDLHEVIRSSVMQRLYDSLTCKEMDEQDVDELFAEISDGMFYTDRISLDNHFSKDISAERYINWIKDLMDNGSINIVMKYKSESTGFFIMKEEENGIFHSILGGGYKRFNKTGLGTVLKEMEYVKNLGGKKVYTSVSSNNIRQLRNLIINGYIPTGVDHVFVRYKD